MSRRFWQLNFLCLMLVFTGCTKPAATRPADESKAANAVEVQPEAKPSSERKPIIPVRKDVKTFEGNWALVVTANGKDNFVRIIRIEKDSEGKYTGKLVDSVNADSELLECVVEDKSVKLKLKDKKEIIDFHGYFDGAIVIRGTVSSGIPDPLLARLLPTDATQLKDYAPTAFPPGMEQFRQASEQMKNRPQIGVIVHLARENRNSPIAYEAIAQLVQNHLQFNLDDNVLKALFVEYLNLSKVWGPRLQFYTELQCAQQYLSEARSPDETLKHLEEAEKLIPDHEEVWKPRIKVYRETAEVLRSLAKSKSTSDQDRQEANAELQNGLKQQPFNAEVLMALAEYAVSQNQVDTAIEHYSTIVALPLLEQFVLMKRAGQPAGDPTPSEILKKLWKDRNGSDAGLEAHLSTIHHDRLAALRAQIREEISAPLPADAGNHTVLLEFFTGAQMPGAVASEIAVDALRETYPMSNLIVLRYHQHIPAPDGLVNQDSEDCLASYESAKVPLMAFDGARFAPPDGYLQHSGIVFGNLRSIIDHRLKQSTPVQIELNGKVVDGELTIQASVSGVSEEQLPSLRLRLAIAEEEVEMPAPIGIRRHGMLVREMPGGVKGIAPKKGELKFALSMPLEELQKHLDEYINRYQAGKGIEFPPFAKPPVRGKLYLVGWVQNDRHDNQRPDVGRAILQSAIVPIAGTGETSAQTEEHKPESLNPEPQKPVTESVPAADSDTPPPPALPE